MLKPCKARFNSHQLHLALNGLEFKVLRELKVDSQEVPTLEDKECSKIQLTNPYSKVEYTNQ
jgi:hypothetical protein